MVSPVIIGRLYEPPETGFPAALVARPPVLEMPFFNCMVRENEPVHPEEYGAPDQVRRDGRPDAGSKVSHCFHRKPPPRGMNAM